MIPLMFAAWFLCAIIALHIADPSGGPMDIPIPGKCSYCLLDDGHEMSCPFNPVNK